MFLVPIKRFEYFALPSKIRQIMIIELYFTLTCINYAITGESTARRVVEQGDCVECMVDWTRNTIYRRIGNWTAYFYSLPGGYRLVLLTTVHIKLLIIIKCDVFCSKSR